MGRKVLTYLLCGVMLVTGLCGCQSAKQTGESGSGEESMVEVSTAGGTENSVKGEDTMEGVGKEELPENNAEKPAYEITIEDISSAELVAGMKIGWNLGNTLDATGGMGVDSERAWGNPKTSQEMIDAVLAQGFNVIRIPVTWEGHFGAAPDYKIHDIWLERVKEVVDYAYNRGAYVILNLHHEEWHYPSEENKEAASEQLAALWTQIADYFRDYDEHLIFEGLNEPRKKGTSVEWTGDEEGFEVVNHFAQVFVDTVRATGGNNELRHLMVTGYAASSGREALESIVVPDDDRLIVSVHAYTPYNFALNTKGTASWSIEKDTYDIDALMKNIDELFLSKGIPVIIGEFGAMNKDNEAERVEWVTYYLTKAKEIGVPCIWWDNNAYDGSGENFGLFDRRNLEFVYKDLVNAMISTVNGETVVDDSANSENGAGEATNSEDAAGGAAATQEAEAVDLSALEGKKLIAVTVDDGPDGSGTKEFIRVAKEYEAPLTFFVVGQNIANNSGQLEEMLAAGCEIGNHSTTHVSLTDLDAGEVKEEITQTNALIEKYAPEAEINFVRAPYFAYNDVVYENVNYPLIDAALAESGTDYEATLKVLLGASDGDIVLMHTWNTASLQALEEAIPKLKEEGFAFVTVSQLFAARGMEPLEGTVYRHIGENLSSKYEIVSNLFTGENSASGDWSNWETAVELDKTVVAAMTEEQAIKVEYQSTVGPCLILQSWTGGPEWIQMTPSSDDGKTAIFTYEDIIAAYDGPLENLDAVLVRPYGADITVTSVDLMQVK